MAEPVHDARVSLRSGGGEAARRAAAGAALSVAAIVISALVARRNERAAESARPAAVGSSHKFAFQTPRPLLGAIWPPVLLALTLSGLRLWTAPASAARTRALTLWTLIQGLNAACMAWGPRRAGGQITAAAATLGAAAAYALEARKVEAPSANLAGPYLGWMGFANILTDDLWRKHPEALTLH
ncbi:MAG TPA: TspO/MBR family protein [Caulobacteraceae bacterium]